MPTTTESQGGRPASPEAAALSAGPGGIDLSGAGDNGDLERRHRRTARIVFRLCLAFTSLLTLIWLFLVTTQRDGGLFFRNYNTSLDVLIRGVVGFVFLLIVWSYGMYRLKRFLLRRIGFSDGELRSVFGSRGAGFDLDGILKAHAERAIRIVDMVGRRGRTFGVAIALFCVVYLQIEREPSAGGLALGLQTNMFNGLMFNWWSLLTFHSDSFMGRVAYGASARIRDGVQGRVNMLSIATLWSAFKFVMIPLGLQLAEVYPPEAYAAMYAFIWLSYGAADLSSEVCGSIFGKQTLKVWGLGDINRKSWAGTIAAFLASLAVCVLVAYLGELSMAWYVLALVISLANAAVELYSPRGTDDFTMATTNALICWGFGALALAR